MPTEIWYCASGFKPETTIIAASGKTPRKGRTTPPKIMKQLYISEKKNDVASRNKKGKLKNMDYAQNICDNSAATYFIYILCSTLAQHSD